MSPNPEAIAWYVQKSEKLLDDLREQVRALRLRGGQLAGFAGAVLALAGPNAGPILGSLHGVGRAFAGTSLLVAALLLIGGLAAALRGTVLPRFVSDISIEEVATYTTERFINEPDLWRVHVRTIRNLLSSIESTRRQRDAIAEAVRKAEFFFLVGLFSVGVALAILISVVTF